MSGDWIKMRVDLRDDPAVIRIAATLDLDEFEVVGRLHHLWAWADRQSRDGNADGVTKKWIDRYVQRDGFAQSMVEVGWLRITDTGILIPNFERHNGKSAKKRALTKERASRFRNADSNAPSVTRALPEKRREDISPISPSRWGPARAGVDPEAWEEWAKYKKGKPAAGTVTKTANFLAGYSPDVQRQIVGTSIRNAWKGLFEPKPGQAPMVHGPKLRLLTDA